MSDVRWDDRERAWGLKTEARHCTRMGCRIDVSVNAWADGGGRLVRHNEDVRQFPFPQSDALPALPPMFPTSWGGWYDSDARINRDIRAWLDTGHVVDGDQRERGRQDAIAADSWHEHAAMVALERRT